MEENRTTASLQDGSEIQRKAHPIKFGWVVSSIYKKAIKMAGINRFTVDASKSSKVEGIFNESVCGLVFDTSQRGYVFNGYPLALQNYGNNQIQVLGSMDDVVASGITENGIMNGVPYYHLKHFFTLAEKDSQEHYIYVVFANCGSGFQVFNHIMQAVGKKVFQFGLWTERRIFETEGEELVSPLLTQLYRDLFSFRSEFQQSEEYDLDIPFNVLLCACPAATRLVNTTVYITDQEGSRLTDSADDGRLTAGIIPDNHAFGYRTLPSVRNFDIPGLSILLGQEKSDEVRSMQLKNVSETPVGCIGAALGVLTICPVEYHMNDNYNYSLKDIIPEAELGFGDDNTPISKINYIRRNELHNKGYIMLVDKDGFDGETFFSSDITLGKRDFSNLMRCRTINKVHRIVRGTLLSQVNAPHILNPSNGNISLSAATYISNEIYRQIDAYMGIGWGLTGSAQLDSRRISVPTDQDLVHGDSLKVEVEIKPADHTESIILQEEVTQ